MNIIRILIILILISITVLSFKYYQAKKLEQELYQCIQNILINTQTTEIQIDTKNRGMSPLLSGITTLSKKQTIKNRVIQLCRVNDIEDFIEIKTHPNRLQPFINFNIDDVNKIISIKGVVNNQVESEDILKSFKTAKSNMLIQHDISIDSKVPSKDFAIDITLLLSSIDAIRVADISFKNEKLILKGLVRDKYIKQSTLDKLHQLFDDAFIIDDKLQLVADNKIELNNLKYKPISMPILVPDRESNRSEGKPDFRQ